MPKPTTILLAEKQLYSWVTVDQITKIVFHPMRALVRDNLSVRLSTLFFVRDLRFAVFFLGRFSTDGGEWSRAAQQVREQASIKGPNSVKYFHIIIGPFDPPGLRSLGETPGVNFSFEILKKLNSLKALKASSLIVSSVSEGKGIMFNALVKFTEGSVKSSEIRGKLSSLFPPSVPIQQIRALSGWDRILRRMLAEGPLVASLADEDDPDIVRIFEVKTKGGFDRIRRRFTSFRRVCRRCGHSCRCLGKKR